VGLPTRAPSLLRRPWAGCGGTRYRGPCIGHHLTPSPRCSLASCLFWTRSHSGTSPCPRVAGQVSPEVDVPSHASAPLQRAAPSRASTPEASPPFLAPGNWTPARQAFEMARGGTLFPFFLTFLVPGALTLRTRLTGFPAGLMPPLWPCCCLFQWPACWPGLPLLRLARLPLPWLVGLPAPVPHGVFPLSLSFPPPPFCFCCSRWGCGGNGIPAVAASAATPAGGDAGHPGQPACCCAGVGQGGRPVGALRRVLLLLARPSAAGSICACHRPAPFAAWLWEWRVALSS
jgi:hypothetical protein